MKNASSLMLAGSLRNLRIGNAAQADREGQLRVNSNMLEVSNGGAWSEITPLEKIVLFDFSSHVFTNAGTEGRLGPTLSAVRSAYSTTSWRNNTSFLNVSNGIQLFTVPKDGRYRIVAIGATRGHGVANRSLREVEGVFRLRAGDVLHILVGQRGSSNTPFASSGMMVSSGGGGSFVWCPRLSSEFPLVVSGGEGGAMNHAVNRAPASMSGASTSYYNGDGVYSQPGGIIGSRGVRASGSAQRGSPQGGGGGGWRDTTPVSNITGQSATGYFTASHPNGAGGRNSDGKPIFADGGFGGGGLAGASLTNTGWSAGGGGGYSGGDGSAQNTTANSVDAGTGGNFVNTSLAVSQTSRLVSVTLAHGRVTVSYVGE